MQARGGPNAARGRIARLFDSPTVGYKLTVYNKLSERLMGDFSGKTPDSGGKLFEMLSISLTRFTALAGRRQQCLISGEYR